MKKTVTIGMLSYNRPLFLATSIPQIFEKAGYDFKFILWDNASNEETRLVEMALAEKYGFEVVINKENVGLQALHHLVNLMDSDYYVLVEDDMLYFPDNWLKDLVAAFETRPDVVDKKTKKKRKGEWGVIATTCFVDEVNNGGMWPSRWGRASHYEMDGIRYIGNVRAAGGAMIMKTRLAQKYTTDKMHFFTAGVDRIIEKFAKDNYMLAHARDICIYHAASPFYNQLYPEAWGAKQGGGTIEEGFKAFKKKGDFNFEDNDWILSLLKHGLFEEYVKKLKPLDI
jgi:glycosyltransferase involved in cell wall biosynthesis